MRGRATAATLARLVPGAVLAAVPGGPAAAHTSERAFILLLPTDLYIAGGAAAVALSFVVIALIPVAGVHAVARARWRLAPLPRLGPEAVSLAAFAAAAALIAAGYAGSRDPLANPLPPVVWTLWWVGLTFLHAVLGNLWAGLNPWLGPYRIVTALPGLRRWRARPPLAWPPWLGHAPAIALLFAFAWFELVDPAPQDPARLATAAAAYGAVTLAGMLAFGARAWLARGEAFAVFFRIVSWLSPFDAERESRPVLRLTVPGARLLRVGTLPPSAAAFVLLALASVSFDGLSRTFWWLDLVGANPLEYPGRTALVGVNTLGLVAVFCALVAVYAAAVLAGRALAGAEGGARGGFGRFVVSIVPIAFGYHFAHYLPTFLVNGQYAVRALSDPFALGWDLFGTAGLHVTASFLANHDSVRLIWNVQVGVIVVAHVVAVAVAHALALGAGAGRRRALLSQLPMTALMIAYTLFGLWLLATPAVG